MNENKSLLSRIVTWTIVGLLAFVAIKLSLRLLGVLFGLMGIVLGMGVFLIFTLGPIVLVGWLGVIGWRAFTREPLA